VKIEDTVILLCDGIVEGYSIQTGRVVFQISALRLPIDLAEDRLKTGEASDPMELTRPMKESVSYKCLKGVYVPLKQSDPCCVHYSRSSGHVVVGYTDGIVSLITFELTEKQAMPPEIGTHMPSVLPTHTYRLNTQGRHNSAITFLTTIRAVSGDVRNSFLSLPSTLLIIGDNDGVLSIWKVPHKDAARYVRSTHSTLLNVNMSFTEQLVVPQSAFRRMVIALASSRSTLFT
jgi:WD40 repeat protein